MTTSILSLDFENELEPLAMSALLKNEGLQTNKHLIYLSCAVELLPHVLLHPLCR